MASKSWFPHLFNTEDNLGYIGPISDTKYYGVNEIGKEERQEFLAWYDSQKSELSEKVGCWKAIVKMTSRS